MKFILLSSSLLILIFAGCTKTQRVMAPPASGVPSSDPPVTVQLEILSVDCEESLQVIVESQLLKLTKVKLTPKDPTHRMQLTCYWGQSPPGSTSFYPTWGEADLTLRLEELNNESVIYADAFTSGAKSRGLAMKKAAEKAINDLLDKGLLPMK
jgi:hypothetical protein